VHFVTGGPFGLHDFGTFPGLPSEDLQQHEVIYLIVLGLAAAGIAAMLFFLRANQCRGRHFVRSARIRYWHSATGHGKASRQAKPRSNQQGLRYRDRPERRN
jgi:hypothetical protein